MDISILLWLMATQSNMWIRTLNIHSFLQAISVQKLFSLRGSFQILLSPQKRLIIDEKLKKKKKKNLCESDQSILDLKSGNKVTVIYWTINLFIR